jgi:formate dehydrogenase major subunit
VEATGGLAGDEYGYYAGRRGGAMGVRETILSWPVARQLRPGGDHLGLGPAVRSRQSEHVYPRTEDADRVVPSICPFCAVGCGQRIYVRGDEILHIEGDPASPVSRGRLCARGSSTKELVTGDARVTTVRYRRPHGRAWEDLSLAQAMDMIAERIVAARAAHWQDADDDGVPLNRTLAFGTLGGAACDNEENYLIKKLFTALGALQIENQARI